MTNSWATACNGYAKARQWLKRRGDLSCDNAMVAYNSFGTLPDRHQLAGSGPNCPI